jgi:hypothetical protein
MALRDGLASHIAAKTVATITVSQSSVWSLGGKKGLAKIPMIA